MARFTVGMCETQPITAEGVRTALETNGENEVAWVVGNLPVAHQLLLHQPPDVLLLDKAFGAQAVLDLLAELRNARMPCAAVVWGVSMTEAEALRLLQSGARGIMRKTADAATLRECIRAVAGGGAWMEDCVFRDGLRQERSGRHELTAREQQVLELVEQGMKNREIASELGIRPGTVKIHLKHIFEKTGVRGRYGLALNGIRLRNVVQTLPLREAAC
jgi:DNA-binding NarL/FixJ family response regulator